MLTGGEHVRVSWTVLWVVSRVYRGQNRPKTGPKQGISTRTAARAVSGLFRGVPGLPDGHIGVCTHTTKYDLVHPSGHPKTTLLHPCTDPPKGGQNRPKTGPKRPSGPRMAVLGLFWACFEGLLRGLRKGPKGVFWGVPGVHLEGQYAPSGHPQNTPFGPL